MQIIKGLTPDEWRIAIACVRAIVEGPWFSPDDPGADQELETVLSFTRAELREIYKQLCADVKPDNRMLRAIGQCLNSVCGFPAPKGSAGRWVATNESELEALCDKWFREVDP
ncbi:hypothetical protein PLCT2_01166 [Planctomycetaceae bacterium]|nr:hypothetical protein PLCT2_01166 [Planctomycetaceae bacterium]